MSGNNQQPSNPMDKIIIVILLLIVCLIAGAAYLFVQNKPQQVARTTQQERQTALQGKDLLREQLRETLSELRNIANEDILIQSAGAQTDIRLSRDTILSRDKAWKENTDVVFKQEITTNTPSQLLKSKVDGAGSRWTELFVTDNQGANVAAYPATSDYWQGDEDKFTDVLDIQGNQINSFWMGDLEWDQSSRTYAVQLSVPVIRNGVPVGVITGGVALDWLADELDLESFKDIRTQLN